MSPNQNSHLRLHTQDSRAWPRQHQYDPNGRWAPYEDGALWPNSRMMGGSDTTVLFGQDASQGGKFEVQPLDEGGGQQMVKISGQTKDSGGNPLSYVTVSGFLTADGSFVRQIVSDVGGYYVFTTQYLTAHYLVAYKAGSPDVAGSTVNTLIGS